MRDALRVHRRLFKDADVDGQLERSGIASSPALTADEVEELTAAYWAVVPASDEGMCIDYVREDRATVRRLAELSLPIWRRAFDRLFVEHEPVLVSFIAKHPGDRSDFFLHRDVTAHDDRHTANYTMWIPLVDVGPELDNGPLEVVDGSQVLPSGFDGVDATVLLSPYARWLGRFARPLSLPAGEAVVYDARLLHRSGPNRSGVTRLAMGCLVARKGEQIVQLSPTGRRHRQMFEVDTDFFLDHHPRDIAIHGFPTGYRLVDEFDVDPVVSAVEIADAVSSAEPAERQVVLPDDVEAEDPTAVLTSRVSAVWRPERDLTVTSSDLGPLAAQVGDLRVVRSSGVGAIEVIRRYRLCHASPLGLADLVDSITKRTVHSCALLVIDPRGRVTFELTHRFAHHFEVVVVECPAVKSGVLTGDGVAELEPGLAFALAPDSPITVWNDGPGSLVAMVVTSFAPMGR